MKCFQKALDSVCTAGSLEKEYLLSRYIVCRFTAHGGFGDDPSLLELIPDQQNGLIDLTCHQSWWHVSTCAQSPKRCTFMRLQEDDRVEEQFADGEIKLRAVHSFIGIDYYVVELIRVMASIHVLSCSLVGF